MLIPACNTKVIRVQDVYGDSESSSDRDEDDQPKDDELNDSWDSEDDDNDIDDDDDMNDLDEIVNGMKEKREGAARRMVEKSDKGERLEEREMILDDNHAQGP